MESWNVYSQNTPSTPSSAWLCPNNAPGSDWLHPQNNNNIERERNENNAALATPTRFIMEYNDVNQSSSGPYCNPYAQEMERLFENTFLKIGNPEDDLLNNNLSSWLNANESVVAVTTAASNVMVDPVSAYTNSPTPSLVTDDDQDQLYNKLQERRTSTFIDDDRFPMTTSGRILTTMPSSTNANLIADNQQQIIATSSSTRSTSSSPKKSHDHTQREQQQKVHYPSATSSSFYRSTLTSSDKQDLYIRQRLLADGKDQYLLTKKHDPKQLLLPLTIAKESMDSTMTVAITSPSPSLATDDDVDQFQKESHQDFQLSISTNDLPMQQPSPASSEYFSSNSKSPSSNETTPKQKKRRFSQRKIKRPTKVDEDALTSTDELFSDQDLMISATTAGQASSTVTSAISNESSTTTNMVLATASSTSAPPEFSETSAKRSAPIDDGHDESPEEKRSRLLERNRIAAAKCRQKKKLAQETLQQQASDLTQRNTTMHSLVNDLREEALKLKNQLLAHSTCNCNVIQEYVRTSGQFAFARAPYTK